MTWVNVVCGKDTRGSGKEQETVLAAAWRSWECHSGHSTSPATCFSWYCLSSGHLLLPLYCFANIVTQRHCLCFLCSSRHRLSVVLSLLHCSCCVTAPTAWSQGIWTPLWVSAHFCPIFPLSTPNRSQIQIVWKRLCLIGQSSSRIQWPRWAEFLHQPVSLAIGHPEYHSLWVKHQFLVQSAITKEAGLWLTSCQPMHRALSAAACVARGCGSAWQSQLTFLQNNVLVCCLPSWVWLCQLFNFAANNVRQNVITIIKLLAQFESYFTYVKIKSNLNTSTRRK